MYRNYKNTKLDGLQEILPYSKRNGKDGFLVTRGKSRTPNKGGRNGKAITTTNPILSYIESVTSKPSPKNNREILMGEIADYYNKVW